jgi:hypothetical protein
LSDGQKIKILELALDEKTQEAIRYEVRCRQQRIGKWLKKFKEEMSWEEARAFCGDRYEDFLRLRKDYVDRKLTEAREQIAKLQRELATRKRTVTWWEPFHFDGKTWSFQKHLVVEGEDIETNEVIYVPDGPAADALRPRGL